MNATVTVEDPEQHVYKLFLVEQQRLVNERASYQVSIQEGGLTRITVAAQDAVALRSVLNSVVKTLIVYEKMKRVVCE
jgi:tRNA threonylcarbamoyladenosine modification (KEOPS) complex  Pcc1 subunit